MSIGQWIGMVQRVTEIAQAPKGDLVGKGAAEQDVEAELAGHYGFYSRAPDGSDGFVVYFGDQSAVVLGVRHRPSEPTCEKGEVMLVDDQQQSVKIKRGAIELSSGGTTFKIDRATGNVTETLAQGATHTVLGGAGEHVARRNDAVTVTIPAGTVLVAAQAGVLNPAPIQLSGTIQNGRVEFLA